MTTTAATGQEHWPRPAGALRRAAARLTDVLTVFFLLWTLAVLQALPFLGPLSRSLAPPPWGQGFVPTVSFGVLYAGYEVVFVRFNDGQTPGKDLFGVRVVTPSGRAPGAGRAVARWLLPGAAMLATPLPLAAVLVGATALPALVGRRRTLADRLAGTVVVRHRREGATPGWGRGAVRRAVQA